MPVATKKEQREYKFDEAWYRCVLSSVEEQVHPYFKRDRKTGEKTSEQAEFRKWVWKFEITSGAAEFVGEYLRGESTAEYTTREDNRIRQWGEALLNRELAIGEEIDTDLLIGLPCLVFVKHGDPEDKKDGTKFYPCYVHEVMPQSDDLFDDDIPF